MRVAAGAVAPLFLSRQFGEIATLLSIEKLSKNRRFEVTNKEYLLEE